MRNKLLSTLLLAVSLLVASTWPQLGWAQTRPVRIGFLSPATGGVWPELRDALLSLGYVEGKNTVFEVRLAGNNIDKLPALASELVRSSVDLIIAVSPAAILAAKHATNDVPIVMAFWGGGGLVESGIVASFARPGGNVTGMYMLGSELEAKRLDLLLETLPGAKNVALLNPGPKGPQVADVLALASGVKTALQLTAMPGPDGYDTVFEGMQRDHTEAVLVPSFPRFYFEHRRIIEAAARHRIPAMYEWGQMARAGGLMAYGPDFSELCRRVASYVDRIAKGAKPGLLPVEQPTRFELVVNLRTANALGLTIPPTIMLRADEVIR